MKLWGGHTLRKERKQTQKKLTAADSLRSFAAAVAFFASVSFQPRARHGKQKSGEKNTPRFFACSCRAPRLLLLQNDYKIKVKPTIKSGIKYRSLKEEAIESWYKNIITEN